GDNHEPMRFCTWSPTAVAMIGELPDTLHDRSIVILLQRKSRDDKVERFRLDQVDGFIEIRSKIRRWVIDTYETLQKWDGDVPEALHDRAADNWRPLLAIADAAGGEWPSLARVAAFALTDSEDDRSLPTLLLRDLRDLFDREGTDRLT